MKMTEPIRGKVARILDERRIALNLGYVNGVSVGMYFDVINPNGQDIEDPDTGDSLGSIEFPKVRVRVTHVQEKLSVATTYQTREVNVGGSGGYISLGPFARSLMPPEWVKKYETLKVSEDIPDDLDEINSAVKTGDPVVQIVKTDKPKQKDTNKNNERQDMP